MHFMVSQYKQIGFDNCTQLNYQTKNLDHLILKAINMSYRVYVYGAYNHLLEKTL